MIATLLSPDDHAWSKFLTRTRHDVYHLPEYVCASASHEGGRPRAFYAEDDSGALFFPLLIRRIPGTDDVDASSPYGYPAPLWTTPDPSPHWTAFFNTAQEHGLVSTFVRLHPLLPIPSSSVLDTRDGVAVVEHGPTVWIDCTQLPEEMWKDTRPDHRSDIRRLRRLDYHLDVSQDASSIPKALDVFVRLYRETMDRVGADSFYYFSDAYFHTWTDSLLPYCQIAVVRASDGEAAAAGLFTNVQGWMQFHLSGTATSHRNLAPSKLMLHEIRAQAHESGHSRLHLGGGLGADEDSIFNFKAGFSSSRATFCSLRMICDQDAYQSLCKKGSSSSPSEDFFPTYRCPQ